MRFWTVAEARAYLPRLRELVETVQAAVTTAAAARTNGHGSSPSGGSKLSVRQALTELERNDIVVRDPATGLVDFRARGADGVVYLLCWLPDEEDLAWWHLPEEGFAGRKPLPRDPA
jgi:hypothetical protein